MQVLVTVPAASVPRNRRGPPHAALPRADGALGPCALTPRVRVLDAASAYLYFTRRASRPTNGAGLSE